MTLSRMNVKKNPEVYKTWYDFCEFVKRYRQSIQMNRFEIFNL